MVLQLIIALLICFLIAELFGTSKHIGRWWAFILLISGFIPGVIAIVTSPSANKQATKGGKGYFIGGVICIIFSILNALILNFSAISFIIIAIYLFQLYGGKIVNQNPKFYFKIIKKFSIPNTGLKEQDSSMINELNRLLNAGVINQKEYDEKVLSIRNKNTENELFQDLERLFSKGILSEDEFLKKKEQIFKSSAITNQSNNLVEKKYSSQTIILSIILISAIFVIIYLLMLTPLSLDNFNYKKNLIEKEYIYQPIQIEEKIEREIFMPEPKPVVTFVYCVVKNKTPKLIKDPFYVPDFFDSEERYNHIATYIINYDEFITTTKIEEIKNYTLDKGNKMLDETESYVGVDMSSDDSYFYSTVNANVKDPLEREILKQSKSEITFRKIYTFNSYTEASEHKRKNYGR